MNRKGETTVGMIIMLAITLIVGMTLLIGSGGIAGTSARLTSTSDIGNETVTLAAADAIVERTDCVNYAGTPVVTNSTDGTVLTDGNYTFGTGVSTTTGYKVVQVTTDTDSDYASLAVNMSYTCLPQGYAEDGASRTIVGLIVLFVCLALAGYAIGEAMKNMKE